MTARGRGSSRHTNGTLRQVSYTYLSGPDGGTQIDTVTATDETGQTAKTSYEYGNFGRVANVNEFGFSASIQRKTTFQYSGTLVAANLLQVVKQIDVFDGGGANAANIARTVFTLDDYAVKGGMQTYAIMPPPQTHDSTFDQNNTTRGNVTGVTSWINVAQGTTIPQRNSKYDVFGNVLQADVSCCQVKNINFLDGSGNPATYYSQPMSVTDGTPNVAPFLTTSFQYDFNTGLVTSTTDPQNLTTSFHYDTAWRLNTVTPPQSAFTTTTQLDKDANNNDLLAYSQKVGYTDVDGVSKTITSKSWFDGAGRVIRAGTGQGSTPANFDTVKTLYDPVGRVLKQSNPYLGDGSGNGSPVYWTKNVYDPLSRVTEADLPDDQPSGQRSRILTGYNSAVVTVTDQVGRKRQSEVDGLGRLIKVTEQNPATGLLDATNYLTTYTYDTLDNLTGVNQGGQTRSFVYDALSRMTSQTTPEGGAVSFVYTDFHAVLKRTDARNVETHYKYDTLNRPTQVWYTDIGGSDDPTVVPRPALPSGVAATSDVIIAYNNLSSAGAGNGATSRIDDGAGFETYAYDSLGRATSKTRTIDGNSYQTQYQYNAINQPALMIYPSGKRVRMNHDLRGRFSGEDKVDTVGTVLTSYVSSVGYNVASQVTGMTLGSGVVESYIYSNDRLQLTRQTATRAATLIDLNYSYAAAGGASGTGTTAGNSGQLISITGTINGQGRNETYTYDDLGRLASATGFYSQRNYTYDRWGNRRGGGGGQACVS